MRGGRRNCRLPYVRSRSVQTAFGLGQPLPAPTSRIGTRERLGRAGSAADGRITVVNKRIDEHIVVVDVGLYVVIGPFDQRVDFHQLVALVKPHHGGVSAGGSLTAAQSGDPCGIPAQRLAQWSDLAQPAAFAGIARKQIPAQQFVLLGDGLLGSDVEHPNVVDGFDRVAGADGFHEVVARVQEDDRHTRPDLGGHIDQYGLLHAGRHYIVAGSPAARPVEATESLVSPTHYVGGTGALEFRGATRRQPAQLAFGTSRGSFTHRKSSSSALIAHCAKRSPGLRYFTKFRVTRSM